MEIGMLKFSYPPARRAGTARIGFGGRLAIDVLGVSQGQGQGSVSFGSKKQLGMTNAVFPNRVDQVRFNVLLANDVGKLHNYRLVSGQR